jgi:hypothetical protein
MFAPRNLQSRNEGIKKILRSTQKNARKQIKGVNISSYASPDGPED